MFTNIINQNIENVNTNYEIFSTFKKLGINNILRSSNITKSCGIPTFEIFKFLFLLVFQGKNLFRFLQNSHTDKVNCKNTYYRFLSNNSFNWNKFLSILSFKVTLYFTSLTKSNRIKVFVIDDTVFNKNLSKNVELLSKVYDHVNHSFVRVFSMLTLGWTGRDYTSIVAHTTIVFTRYTVLAYIRRNTNAMKSYG